MLNHVCQTPGLSSMMNGDIFLSQGYCSKHLFCKFSKLTYFLWLFIFTFKHLTILKFLFFWTSKSFEDFVYCQKKIDQFIWKIIFSMSVVRISISIFQHYLIPFRFPVVFIPCRDYFDRFKHIYFQIDLLIVCYIWYRDHAFKISDTTLKLITKSRS